MLGGDEVEVDGVMALFLARASHKEVFLTRGIDHHGVSWQINVEVVLAEPRLASHNIQTFHVKNIERIMKSKRVNSDACIVQNVCACKGSSVWELDGEGMWKRKG